MLKKIKKLLDSGCYVEVEIGKNPTTGLNQLVKILGYNDIDEKIILFTDGAEIIYIKGKGMEIFSHFGEIIEITSIKPIARPLYEYKVGDKVVVLDNYKGDDFKVGKEYEVYHYRLVGPMELLYINKYGVQEEAEIDIRCIAPVLD